MRQMRVEVDGGSTRDLRCGRHRLEELRRQIGGDRGAESAVVVNARGEPKHASGEWS